MINRQTCIFVNYNNKHKICNTGPMLFSIFLIFICLTSLVSAEDNTVDKSEVPSDLNVYITASGEIVNIFIDEVRLNDLIGRWQVDMQNSEEIIQDINYVIDDINKEINNIIRIVNEEIYGVIVNQMSLTEDLDNFKSNVIVAFNEVYTVLEVQFSILQEMNNVFSNSIDLLDHEISTNYVMIVNNSNSIIDLDSRLMTKEQYIQSILSEHYSQIIDNSEGTLYNQSRLDDFEERIVYTEYAAMGLGVFCLILLIALVYSIRRKGSDKN